MAPFGGADLDRKHPLDARSAYPQAAIRGRRYQEGTMPTYKPPAILTLLTLIGVGCATPESGQSTQVPAPVVYVTNNFGNGHTVSTDEHTNAQSPGISSESTQEAKATADVKPDITVPVGPSAPIPVVPE